MPINNEHTTHTLCIKRSYQISQYCLLGLVAIMYTKGQLTLSSEFDSTFTAVTFTLYFSSSCLIPHKLLFLL